MTLFIAAPLGEYHFTLIALQPPVKAGRPGLKGAFTTPLHIAYAALSTPRANWFQVPLLQFDRNVHRFGSFRARPRRLFHRRSHQLCRRFL